MKGKALVYLAVAMYCLLPSGCGPANNSNSAPASAANQNKQSAPSVPPSAAIALPETAFKVEWVTHHIPSEMPAGKEQKVAITLKNAGNATWPSKGKDGTYVGQVSAAYHWLPAKGDKALEFEGARTAFSHDIVPGETITLDNMTILPPAQPGSYRLQITLVQDAVAWFEERGASTVTVPVTVR